MKINSKVRLAIAFTLGIGLGIFKNKVGLNQNELIMFFSLVIVILFLPDIIKGKQIKKRYKSILQILHVEKEPTRFIHELETLINDVDDLKTRNSLNMTLAAGYCENGEYDKAHQLIMSLNLKNFSDLGRVIYYINMFAVTYNLGDEDKAATILDDNMDLIKQYENHPQIGGAIAANFVYRYLAENNLIQAEHYLKKAEKFHNSGNLNDAIEYLKANILVKNKCYDDARNIIYTLKENGTTPSLKIKITKLESAF